MHVLLVVLIAMSCLLPLHAQAFTRIVAQDNERNPAGATNISVTYSDACADYVGLAVTMMGRNIYQEIPERVTTVVGQAVKTVRAECPQAKRIDVGIWSNANRRPPVGFLRAELTEANGWQLKPEPTSTVPEGYTPFKLGLETGSIKVTESGEVTGFYPLMDGLQARFEGTVTVKKSGDYVYRYQIEGYFYSYDGSPSLSNNLKRKCEQPRKGYAYWSAFQWTTDVNNRLAVGGTHWECGEANSGGKTFTVNIIATGESVPNPFLVVKTDKLPTQTPAGPVVVAQGSGWKLAGNDNLWCTNREFTLTYDGPHDDRLKQWTGGATASYVEFFRQQVLPQLRTQCPKIGSLIVQTIRAGETDEYDQLVYGATSLGEVLVQQSPKTGWGKHYYKKLCAGCHTTGAGGAPIAGKPDGWKQQPLYDAPVGADMVYHFNKMHCPDCTGEQLNTLIRTIHSELMPAVTEIEPRQQKLAAYAKNPGPEQLIKSGLLNDSELIAKIYHGGAVSQAERNRLRSLFLDYIWFFDSTCRKLLPPNPATFTYTYQVRDRTIQGPIHDTDVYVTKDGPTVHMDPKYYAVFAKNPGTMWRFAAKFESPLSPGIAGSMRTGNEGLDWLAQKMVPDAELIMRRTADMRALLANEPYCASPASRRFIDNLHKMLENGPPTASDIDPPDSVAPGGSAGLPSGKAAQTAPLLSAPPSSAKPLGGPASDQASAQAGRSGDRSASSPVAPSQAQSSTVHRAPADGDIPGNAENRASVAASAPAGASEAGRTARPEPLAQPERATPSSAEGLAGTPAPPSKEGAVADSQRRAAEIQELSRAHAQAMEEASQEFKTKMRTATPPERRTLQQEFRERQRKRQIEFQEKLRQLSGR